VTNTQRVEAACAELSTHPQPETIIELARVLASTLDELQQGDRVILPKTEEHARALYLVAFNALQEFEKAKR
jgi:hypothetical protein